MSANSPNLKFFQFQQEVTRRSGLMVFYRGSSVDMSFELPSGAVPYQAHVRTFQNL